MRRIVLIFLILSISFPLLGADASDAYENASEAADIFYDPHTGLTVFPVLQIPSGGKYEGMGTAYTAVARDVGFLESNPSASSLLSFTELSFIHSNWIYDTRVEGVVYTQRFNDLGIGFGGKFLYTPFTYYDDWGVSDGSTGAGGLYSETVATANISYNFLSSYDFYGLAVGANLKVAYRNVPSSDDYPNQSAVALLVDIGTLTRFDFLKYYTSRSKNFSVGAVLKNLGPKVQQEALPAVITVGIAYSPLRPVTLAYDLNIPVANALLGTAEKITMAGGLNVLVAEFFSIHSGFQYRGANPGFTLGAAVDLNRVSFTANYTLDLSTRLNTLDKFSIEAKLNLGDEGRLALRNRVDEYFTSGIVEFSGGNLEKAISFFEKALRLDPDYRPAREYLDEVNRQLKNREKLRSLQ
ncbi:MAG: hypothetical protein HN368_22915 [Spirochaetales bacterium]|nr:hypothetical protein [Spirochaetales bacterium]